MVYLLNTTDKQAGFSLPANIGQEAQNQHVRVYCHRSFHLALRQGHWLGPQADLVRREDPRISLVCDRAANADRLYPICQRRHPSASCPIDRGGRRYPQVLRLNCLVYMLLTEHLHSGRRIMSESFPSGFYDPRLKYCSYAPAG